MAIPAQPLLGKTGATAPAAYAEAVTPSDSVSFTYPARAIYIGGAGNAVLVMADGTAVLFSGLTAGTILPVSCLRVNATNTTATLMVALV